MRTCTAWICALALASVLGGGCSGGGTPSGASAGGGIGGGGNSVAQLITSVVDSQNPTVPATLVASLHPADNGGPPVLASSTRTVLSGGTLPVRVTSPQPLREVAISVDGSGDHYILLLPTAKSQIDLLVTSPPVITDPRTPRFLFFSGRDVNGLAGPGSAIMVDVKQVATGDVQVNVTWDTRADMDLHVTDPSGFEIYFSQPMSPSGGVLDLDSNAGCLSGPQSENIAWPIGRAPSGTYQVSLVLFDDCGAGQPTNFVVTTVVAGTIQVYRGSIGGSGAGVTVAQFTR